MPFNDFLSIYYCLLKEINDFLLWSENIHKKFSTLINSPTPLPKEVLLQKTTGKKKKRDLDIALALDTLVVYGRRPRPVVPQRIKRELQYLVV